MDIFVVMNTMIMLMALLILGFFLAKRNILDEHTSSKLSMLVINISLPAMIIASVKPSDNTVNLLDSIFTGIVFYALSIITAILLTIVIPFKKDERNLYRFMFVFANVSFMGYPIVNSLFGNSAIFINSLVHLPFNVLVFSYGISLFNKKGEKFNWKKLLSAGSISSIIAILLSVFQIRLPDVISNALSSIGSLTTPLSMLIIGASLSKMALKDIVKEKSAWIMSLFRLILIPILGFFIFRLFISDTILLGISAITLAMPPASISVMLTKQYNKENESVASKSVVLSTVLSMVTIPLMAYLFQQF